MKSFPFDSHVTYDQEGAPIFDRAINSKTYRYIFRELFKSGIMPNPSTNMQVTTGEGMNVIVLPGFAMVDGCMSLEEENRTLAVQASETQYDRIDTVVLRLNANDSFRICDLYVVEGVPSSNPVRPDLTREGDIYEIGLADLYITKGSSVISEQKITDTRYENERCGVISSISEFDTTTLDQQMNAWARDNQALWKAWMEARENAFDEWEQDEKTAFEAWLDSIKDILDTNIAAHLQNEIDTINQTLETVESDIVALYGTTLTQTLTAGASQLTFENEAITDTSMIDLYASVYGVNPKTATINGNTLTLEFPKQQSDVDVKVVIK